MRKQYTAPAIESEEVLEQTSLACNVTNLSEQSPQCASEFRKSEAFFDSEKLACQTILEQFDCVAVLS